METEKLTLFLNPNYRFVANRGTGNAYIVSRYGTQSIVNIDAIELMASEDPTWQADPDCAAFVEKAKSATWLVANPGSVANVRWIDRPVHLRRIQYEVNLLCNLKCLHCYCSSSPQAPSGQPLEFVLDLVKQAAELGVLYFDVTGGEPLARKDIRQVLRAIADAGMIPGLLSNCTLVTKDLAHELADIGVASVQASLDSCTPEIHDEIRGKRGAFAAAMRGIAELREAGVPVRISVTLNRRNAHEARDIVRLFQEEMGIPFNFDRVIPAGRSLEQAEPIELTNAEYYSILHSLGGGVESGKVCDTASVSQNGVIDPSCGVGASYVFIKQDGRMALCPTMTEAESPDFAQADLNAMSLADAWERHPTFQRFRGMQCENTRHCPSGKSCRGGCRSNAYLLHGSVSSPDEMHCNFNKNGDAEYRPFLLEYEALREQGIFPARSQAPRARRRLPVLAKQGQNP